MFSLSFSVTKREDRGMAILIETISRMAFHNRRR